jgi:hypothetical protein
MLASHTAVFSVDASRTGAIAYTASRLYEECSVPVSMRLVRNNSFSVHSQHYEETCENSDLLGHQRSQEHSGASKCGQNKHVMYWNHPVIYAFIARPPGTPRDAEKTLLVGGFHGV